MVKVLVTGTAGHLGSFLTNRLLQYNLQVIGIDNLLHGGEGMLSFYSHPNFDFEKLDIRNGLDQIEEKVDYVIHLASLVGPICDKQPDLAWQTNYEATLRVCDWAKKNNSRLIFASTCSNYGIYEGLADENSELNPLGIYAETKVKAERTILNDLRDSINLRFATLAGISPRPRFDTLLNQWVWEANSSGRIECYQPETQRPFTHLFDASEAIYRLITDWSKASHRCYNVVGFNTSKRELAGVISEYIGCEITETGSSIDKRNYAVSAELIKKDLGFKPCYSISDCVEEVFSAIKLGVVKPRPEHYNA